MNEYGYERVERDKSRQATFHAFWCRVDGGTKVHGRRGFRCRRCAEHAADEGTEQVLAAIDRLAPKFF